MQKNIQLVKMSYNEHNCKNNHQKDHPTVGLKKVVEGINLPTVITFATLPGDCKETMFVATQVGEIIAIQGSKARLFLDIKNKVLCLGVKGTPYDE